MAFIDRGTSRSIWGRVAEAYSAVGRGRPRLARDGRKGDHGCTMPAASPPSSSARPVPGPPPPRRRQNPLGSWDAWSERKKTTVVAVAFFGLLGVLLAVVLISAYVGYHPTAQQRADARNEAIADPQSISGPDYGQKPANPGDPGGWEQLAVGGLIMVGLIGGAVFVVRSGRRAKQRRLTEAAVEQP